VPNAVQEHIDIARGRWFDRSVTKRLPYGISEPKAQGPGFGPDVTDVLEVPMPSDVTVSGVPVAPKDGYVGEDDSFLIGSPRR
jgi:hypothetical protein